MIKSSIPYQSPLEAFLQFKHEKHVAFLYSAFTNSYSGKYSVLALYKEDELKTNSFLEFEQRIGLKENAASAEDYFADGWFGYISYEAKHSFEKLPKSPPSTISTHHYHFMRFGLVCVFNNEDKTCRVFASSEENLTRFNKTLTQPNSDSNPEWVAGAVSSNFSRSAYMDMVGKAREYILEGDIFEVNLTQKFSGKFLQRGNTAALFAELMEKSPSHYAAFFRFGELSILSSSPERFVKAKNGAISSKPIKGTRPRGKDDTSDRALKEELRNSQKDRAENAMIVDLVRNDLGRISKIGSVEAARLFEVESYQTVHQMVSTVTSELEESASIFDLIRAAFPPGSMTGAPKIRAMEIASELEKIERGIYSGALGYIGRDHYMDLSVVIRTLIIEENSFEFQVGGAITADSDPASEYQESLDKAKAIFSVLKIGE